MEIYKYCGVLLPITIFYLIRKYYLHSAQLWLLIYAIILLVSTIFGGWIMQLTYLIIVTAMAMQLLSICKQTDGFVSEKRLNFFAKILLRVQQQLSIIVYILSAWLFLRIYTTKSTSYGIGQYYSDGRIFQGLNVSLKGWNCTQLEFVVFPFIWMLINTVSLWIASLIMKIQIKKDNLYKQYILKYKIYPDIVLSTIVFLYNLYSYLSAQSLFQCCFYWQNGYLLHAVWYWGYPLTTLFLFYIKRGVFQVEEIDDNTSDKAQQMDLKERQIQMKLIK